MAEFNAANIIFVPADGHREVEVTLPSVRVVISEVDTEFTDCSSFAFEFFPIRDDGSDTVEEDFEPLDMLFGTLRRLCVVGTDALGPVFMLPLNKGGGTQLFITPEMESVALSLGNLIE
jgi:hypothetical protein